MIVCLLLSLAPFQTDFRRLEAPAPAPVVTEFAAGTELRLHEIGQLTGAARLTALLAELTSAAPRLAPMEVVAKLDRLAALRLEVEARTRGLLEILRDLAQPALGAGQRLELLDGGRLALLGVPEQHAWLAGFLAHAVAFDGLIDIQARIYQTDARTLPQAFASSEGRTLAPGEQDALLRHFSTAKADTILAPRVLVFPFQESRLKSVDEVSYVKDYEIKVLPGQEIADPVIDVAESGVNLRLRALPVEREGLVLYVDLDCSHVLQPMRTFETRLATGASVTIDLPEVTRVGIQGRFELAPGQALLVTSPADPAGERVLLLLVEARRAPAEALPEER